MDNWQSIPVLIGEGGIFLWTHQSSCPRLLLTVARPDLNTQLSCLGSCASRENHPGDDGLASNCLCPQPGFISKEMVRTSVNVCPQCLGKSSVISSPYLNFVMNGSMFFAFVSNLILFLYVCGYMCICICVYMFMCECICVSVHKETRGQSRVLFLRSHSVFCFWDRVSHYPGAWLAG